VQVPPDGKITLPLIGDLEASNKTPIELRDTIASSLKVDITNPTVGHVAARRCPPHRLPVIAYQDDDGQPMGAEEMNGE
jgi:hypothetical protein